jgi:SMC interacting uncharacterized protein involved in chromosome segregation
MACVEIKRLRTDLGNQYKANSILKESLGSAPVELRKLRAELATKDEEIKRLRDALVIETVLRKDAVKRSEMKVVIDEKIR